jgi:hypothetical protein
MSCCRYRRVVHLCFIGCRSTKNIRASSAFTERPGEDHESGIRNEYQQHDEVAGDRFLEPGAKEFAERGSDGLAVKQADDSFLPGKSFLTERVFGSTVMPPHW